MLCHGLYDRRVHQWILHKPLPFLDFECLLANNLFHTCIQYDSMVKIWIF